MLEHKQYDLKWAVIYINFLINASCFDVIVVKEDCSKKKDYFLYPPFWDCTFQHDLIELMTSVNPW